LLAAALIRAHNAPTIFQRIADCSPGRGLSVQWWDRGLKRKETSRGNRKALCRLYGRGLLPGTFYSII